MNLQRRYLRLVLAPVTLPGQPATVAFAVDAEILGCSSSHENVCFAVSAPTASSDPRATTLVSRFVWLICDGGEIPHGAQAGELAGIIELEGKMTAVFVETQEQALVRSNSRR